MRRNLIGLCSLLSVAFLADAASLAAEENDDAALQAVRTKVDAMFDAISPENVSRSPVDGWFTIQKNSIVAYISADGRYLLQGDMIDLDQQLNLSELSRTNARRDLMASIDDDDAILFSPSEVKYKVTVFTDVDCTYCRKLHNQVDEYLAAGIEIRYLLYPRNGPASASWGTSEAVWCARDRNGALTAAKLDRKFESSKCDASTVTRHYMLGQEIGLTGTPAIVFEDGTLISGYLPPATLADRLNAVQQAAAN